MKLDKTNMIALAGGPAREATSGRPLPASSEGDSDAACEVINLASVRGDRDEVDDERQRLREIKSFADELNDLVSRHLTKARYMRAPHAAYVLADLTRAVVMTSFQGLRPDRKDKARRSLQDYLALVVSRRQGVSPPKQ